MDKPFRRYEMLLPLRFNDHRRIPDELMSTRCWNWRSGLEPFRARVSGLRATGVTKANRFGTS